MSATIAQGKAGEYQMTFEQLKHYICSKVDTHIITDHLSNNSKKFPSLPWKIGLLSRYITIHHAHHPHTSTISHNPTPSPFFLFFLLATTLLALSLLLNITLPSFLPPFSPRLTPQHPFNSHSFPPHPAPTPLHLPPLLAAWPLRLQTRQFAILRH